MWSRQSNTSGPTGHRWGPKVGPAAGGLASGAGGLFTYTALSVRYIKSALYKYTYLYLVENFAPT